MERDPAFLRGLVLASSPGRYLIRPPGSVLWPSLSVFLHPHSEVQMGIIELLREIEFF